MPWDRVHAEAEVLEHVLSEELEELIAAKLGDPTHDPHGDPIPTRELTIEEAATESLDALTPAPAALRAGLRLRPRDASLPRRARHRPRRRVEVVEPSRSAGRCSCASAARDPLGGDLARAMRVEVTLSMTPSVRIPFSPGPGEAGPRATD